MKAKRRTLETSLVTLMVVLCLPILSCFLKGPDREIEARTRPVLKTLRGSIFDRTGALLAYSQLVPNGMPRRVYPYEDLARALLGETDSMGHGMSGIELLMDEGLSQGQDVFLTLEREVQIRASDLLQLQLRRFGASYGCMIVMDITTGDVLALASRARGGKGSDYFVPVPCEDKLFRAGGILLPLRWRFYHVTGDDSLPHIKKRSNWNQIRGRYLVWSPWDEGFIMKTDDSRSYIKELIVLGFGKTPDKIPLYVTDVFDDDFKATPIHILHAFAKLLTGRDVRAPRFVKEAAHEPDSTTNGALFGQGEPRVQGAGRVVSEYGVQEVLSGFTVPALATVWWDHEGKVKGRRTCEIMALGFWPKESPEVVYITAIKGALKDPRRRPGYLSRARVVLEAATQLPTEGIQAAVER